MIYQCARGNSANPEFLTFADRVSNKVVDVVSSLVPFTGCFVGAGDGREDLARRVIDELKQISNWDASPGYPFQLAHKDLRSVVEHDAISLVALSVNLLDRWMSIPHQELILLSQEELTFRRYSYPNRIFIKQEPHSLEKALAQRWRLVVSVSAPFVLAQRVLLGPQHRKMVDEVDHTASCIGLGLSDPAIEVLFRKSELVRDAYGLVSSDQSGYDWRWFWFWANLVATVWIRSTGATGRWANAIRNASYCLMASFFVLSDGSMYALLSIAVQRSGSLDTGPGNSVLRAILNVTIRLYLKEMGVVSVPPSRLPCMTMGDDCVESFGCPVTGKQLVELFAGFGFKLTDVYISPDGSVFEFCSARFRRGDDWACEVLSWPRMLFRLLCQEPDDSFLEQFKYELRHLRGVFGGPSLDDLLAFIHWVDWKRESIGSPINQTDWREPHFGFRRHPSDMSQKTAKKGKAGVKKPGRDAELRAAAKQISQKMPTKALSYQVKTIADPLTHQDLAIISYLHTLGDPWVEDPAGVPLMAGGTLMRRTVKAQIKFEVQAVANASGFAVVALDCDGWVGDATTPPTRFASYSGGTQGTPLWYTDASYVGTAVPAFSATTATTGLKSVAMPLLDGQVTSSSNVRMVAAGMRVFSDAAVNTAQGKLAIVATSRPYGNGSLGAIASSSYAILSTLPTDVVSFQAEPCAGWKSGHSLYAVAIPSDPECFTFFNPPAAGSTAFGYPQLAAILSGAAANQTFTAQVVMDYEFDIGVTNLTGVDTDPLVVTSAADLVPHIAQMHAGKTGKGNANKALGAQAFLAQTAMTRPAKIAALVRPSPSLLSTIGGAAKAALGWAASKGLDYIRGFARGVPALGGIMGALGI